MAFDGRAGLIPAIVAALAFADGAARAADGCATPPAASARGEAGGVARVTAVNERLELTLDDGRLLKLAGLDPPRPTPNNPDLDATSGAKLGAWLVGKSVVFRLVETQPDRWGRLPAQVFAPADLQAPPLPVAAAALEAGLGRFEPSPAARPCRAALLAAEAAARNGALGLWADPYYAVIAASDHDAFAEKAATLVIVEGRVTGIDRGTYRTALLFGPRRGHDFSVTILQRNIKIFDAAGLDPDRLQGQIIRVRGLLNMRYGQQIEAASPDDIEAIAPDRDAAGPGGSARR